MPTWVNFQTFTPSLAGHVPFTLVPTQDLAFHKGSIFSFEAGVTRLCQKACVSILPNERLVSSVTRVPEWASQVVTLYVLMVVDQYGRWLNFLQVSINKLDWGWLSPFAVWLKLSRHFWLIGYTPIQNKSLKK